MSGRGLTEAATQVHDCAVHRLEEALVEQDRLEARFDTAVGTSSEFGAYVHLQRAGEQVAARHAWLNWVVSESHRGLNADSLQPEAERGKPGVRPSRANIGVGP
jgi:hypothetical protein